jgi:hypothetical protein
MKNSSIIFLLLLFWLSAAPARAMRASLPELSVINGGAE